MTFSNISALFGSMFVLAIIPSPSVCAVVARSISSGFIYGLIMVMGIIIGDFIFIILAIYGLSAIAETIDSVFILVKYLGSTYLIWLGINLLLPKRQIRQIDSPIRNTPQDISNFSLILTKSNSIGVEKIQKTSWLSTFLSGLFITLGDQKAIFFYLSFFPAFLDLKSVSILDTIIVMAIATITIGGAKLSYAYMADRARSFLTSSKIKKRINAIAGSVMISTGVFLIVKT